VGWQQDSKENFFFSKMPGLFSYFSGHSLICADSLSYVTFDFYSFLSATENVVVHHSKLEGLFLW